jgi:hypothetical protein
MGWGKTWGYDFGSYAKLVLSSPIDTALVTFAASVTIPSVDTAQLQSASLSSAGTSTCSIAAVTSTPL